MLNLQDVLNVLAAIPTSDGQPLIYKNQCSSKKQSCIVLGDGIANPSGISLDNLMQAIDTQVARFERINYFV